MIRKHKPILYDPLIIPRVKQYLEENVHQTYVDVSVMARQLQERYREYNRRKSGPFRNLVEQAYKTVLHSYGLDSNPSSDDDDGGNSELEMMEDNSMSNHMNNMLTNLYTKNKNSNQTAGPTTETNSTTNEAIDISSDESADENLSNGKGNKTGLKYVKEITITKVPQQQQQNSKKDKNLPVSVPEVPPLLGPLKLQQNDKQMPTFPPQPPSQQSNSGKNRNDVDNGENSCMNINKKRKLVDAQKYGPEWKKISSTGPQQQSKNSNSGKLHLQPSNSFSTNKLPPLSNMLLQQSRLRKFKKEINLEHAQFTFQNMGGIERVLKEICELLFHYRNPQIYLHIGLSAPRGLLLHGPPGCGKTMLAEAIAGTLEVPFINVPATELIAGVSGESEERIREIFEQAAMNAPCVLFIDEIDAISSNRLNAQKDMERRIVAQLISSLDGLENLDNGDLVLVVGATNRPEVLDPGLRRVGRFDHEISLGIPDRQAREEILRVICDKLLLETSFDFNKIAEITPGYVGADLFALAFRAASIAIKRKYFNQMRVRQAEAEQNIPIVDLLEESSEINKKPNNDEINKDDNNDNQEKGEIENITETDETEKTEKDETNKNNEEVSKENNNPELGEDSVVIPSDEDDKMEIDDEKLTSVETENKSDEKSIENSNNDKEEPKKSIETDDPELLEKTDNQITDSIEIDEIPESTSVNNIKKNIMKTTKKDPSLLELLKWLKSDTISIQESDLRDLCLTMSDFKEAVKLVQPSSKREGFITVPDVTWNDIGSLHNIREELQLAVLAPVKFPEKLNALGLSAPSGILLCGPPGCGKTLLAKAVANEAGINFISVKGPELMNMYVGESERAVRTCFQRARNSAPCVIFFDEFDSLCPKRSVSGESGSGTRIVNQLLTEMDGIEDRKGVYLLAATNRPDIIDPAILRPGRLDTILYVGLPEVNDRFEILHALTKNRTKPVLNDDVDLKKIGNLTEGYTGADLAGLLRQASLLALKESLLDPLMKPEDLKVNEKHFENALSLIKPSVNAQDRRVYESLRLKYAAPRKNDTVE